VHVRATPVLRAADAKLSNDRYTVTLAPDGTATVSTTGSASAVFRPDVFRPVHQD
jgi:hypothetical protein